jgi:hypothetical protein
LAFWGRMVPASRQPSTCSSVCCIRRAIEERMRVLRGGATTYGFKERLGFEVKDDEYIAFADRGPFVLAERLAHLFPVG